MHHRLHGDQICQRAVPFTHSSDGGGSRRAQTCTDLVSGGEFSPGFIRPAVVVLGLGRLHVLVETQDLPGLEFGHRRPLRQLNREGGGGVSARFNSREAFGRWRADLSGEPAFDLVSLQSPVRLVLGCGGKRHSMSYRDPLTAAPPPQGATLFWSAVLITTC